MSFSFMSVNVGKAENDRRRETSEKISFFSYEPKGERNIGRYCFSINLLTV